MNGKADNRIKGKIAPALLSALAVALTVFVFGPFELYANNMSEFLFALGDFFGLFLLIALGVAILIFSALIFLPRRIFDVACATVSAVALMLYVQGTFLTLGLTSVEGDGVGAGAMATSKIVVNAIIWLLVIGGGVAAALIFSKKNSGGVRTATIFAMVLILGMQSVSFATVAATTEGVFGGKESYVDSVEVLTYKNLDSVGAEENVIYFVVDRFAAEHVALAQRECPEVFESLEGFTYYDDALSLYPRTYPSITYLLTGVENDFSMSRPDYFKHAFGNAEFLDILSREGYSINAYTDSYYAYEVEAAGDLPEYIANRSGDTQIVLSDRRGLANDMARLSLYRYLPFSLRGTVGRIASDDFLDHVTYVSDGAPAYSTDMKDAYDYLSANPLTQKTDKNFSLIHIQGVHLPNKYDRDFNAANTEETRLSDADAIIQSFKIIGLYLEQLKEMGLYENATIIITGDHASVGSDAEDPFFAHLTAIMLKPCGESEGEMKTSSAPIMQEDLHATVLDILGIDAELGYGRSILDISEGDERTRRYHFIRDVKEDGTHEIVIYEIVGSAADLGNWSVTGRIKLDKSIYD